MATRLVLEAITEIKDGKKDNARKLLIEAIKQNSQDEDAWYVMAAVVGNKEQKIECLERVLKINPYNKKASQQLEKIKNPPLDNQNYGEESDQKTDIAPGKHQKKL